MVKDGFNYILLQDKAIRNDLLKREQTGFKTLVVAGGVSANLAVERD